MKLTQRHTRKPFVVDDEDDLEALVRAYRYLDRDNPLWMWGMPGVDNRQLRAEYRAMLAERADLALVSAAGGQQARAA